MKDKNIIKDIVLFILIAIYFASNIFIREVSNLDELWNYNFASNIANGLIPYKDFNMVVTPLLSLIGGIFLNIFGKELLVFRILNITLNTTIIFLMYKIMKQLNIKEYISLLLLMVLTYIHKDYAMFDYNFAISLISLIILYLEIKNHDNNNINYQIIIGVLGGICITLKQTTGLIIAVSLLSYKILDIRNKEDFKELLKLIAIRFIGILIPVMILAFYLIINNAFYDFIDYCILGVKTFTNKVSYLTRLVKNKNILITVFSIMPMVLLGVLVIYIKKRDKNALMLFTFGVASLSVIYPISDETHLISGIFITIISLAYILSKTIKKEYYILKIFLYMFILLFTTYQFLNVVYVYKNSNKNTEIAHYNGLIMEKTQIDYIKKMNTFIEKSKKKVYILDASAAYYMIPINRYNKNYDMFCLGNFGSKGEYGQIEQLQKEKEDIKVLIKNKKYSRNWQNPEQVRKWVIENMNKTGQIGAFDIYE